MKINPIRQRVYKIVYSDIDGTLQSWNSDVRQSRYNIIYKPNELVRPQIGKIFAFHDLQKAIGYDCSFSGREIWEAIGFGASLKHTFLNTTYLHDSNRLEKLKSFWVSDEPNECVMFETYKFVPDSSVVVCKSIKLLKRIR
jgi:hypothetical protein